tara:strand:- start:5250 stop:6596 length:1347 start_codon:yes stop_codon:yes gene_type:complete
MASRIKSPNTFLDRLSAGTQYFQPYSFEPSEEDKKSEEFLLKAAGERAPSTLSMYNSHHALVSQMYDQLTSEDTLNHYAETPEGMVKWNNMMADLEDRINVYEGIYDATYGDPLKADGNGFTFADEEFRSKSTDGNPSKFFPGYDIDPAFDPATTLMEIDRKDAVSNVTLNLETGQFDFDANIAQGQDWFDLSQSLQNTSLFDYRDFQTQTSFNDPLFYSEMGDLYRKYNDYDKSDFKNHFENILSTDINKQRDAAAYYIEELGDSAEFKSVSELMSAASSGDAAATNFLESAYGSFYGAVEQAMDNRKKIQDRKDRKNRNINAGSTGSTDTPPAVTALPGVVTGADMNFDGESFTGNRISFSGLSKFTMDDERVALRSIFKADDGEYFAEIERGDGSIERFPIETDSALDQTLRSILKDEYGENSIQKIIQSLSGTTAAGGGSMSKF